jgi:predicted MFS family arabinose efflux permease
MASLATVIGAPFGNEISDRLGWRIGFRAYSVMALVGAAVFLLFYRRMSDQPATGKRHGPTALDLTASRGPESPFRDPLIWSLILLGTINMGGFSATFFLPSAMETIYELPKVLAKERATQIISSSYVFAIFANLTFGYLCDRFNRWNMMLLLAAVLFFACLALLIENMTVLWISAALLIGLGLSATNQLYALARELSAGKNLPTVMGIASLGGGVFGFLGPYTAGNLVDLTGHFQAVWIFFACSVVVSFIELLVLKRAVEARQAATAAMN